MKQSDKYLPTAFNSALTILERLNIVIKWILDHQNEVEGIEKQIRLIDDKKEDKTHLTQYRKLSELGNFTGSIHGKNSLQILNEISNNTNTIDYLLSQFQDGVTGLVVDGGYFEGGEVLKTYDGGRF